VDGHGALRRQQGVVFVRKWLQAEDDNHGGPLVVHRELPDHALLQIKSNQIKPKSNQNQTKIL
jgi:hypothetical protein